MLRHAAVHHRILGQLDIRRHIYNDKFHGDNAHMVAAFSEFSGTHITSISPGLRERIYYLGRPYTIQEPLYAWNINYHSNRSSRGLLPLMSMSYNAAFHALVFR